MNAIDDVDLKNVMELMAVPGEPGKEADVARLVRQKLIALGVPAGNIVSDQAHRRSEIGGQVGNLIVRFPGRGEGPCRMLATHLDTVPGAVGCKPRLQGDRIVNDAAGKALGADARAGCAVLLAAARALVELAGDHPPRVLVFFVQEEIGLVGSRWLDVELLGEPRPEMCFNFDGAEATEVVRAVIGTERLHITVRGVAAHSSTPRRGISAAAIQARAMAELVDAGWHGVVDGPEGRGLANLGVIHGGTGSNVVMPELYALFEARSHNRDFRRRIVEVWKEAFRRQVQRANDEACCAEGRAEVSFRPGPVYDPYALPENAPVVQAAVDAIRRAGCEAKLIIDDGGQDSAWVVAHGIPAVGLGFGGRAAHSVDEWLDVEQFKLACKVAAGLAKAG